MGNVCDDVDISDENMKWCAEIYKEDYVTHGECKETNDHYYKCVANATKAEICAEYVEDLCQETFNAVDACRHEKYPLDYLPEDEVFDKFCNVVMGKACGYKINDSYMSECVDVYKAEAVYYGKCMDEAEAYYNCVGNLQVTPCAEDAKDCNCGISDNACKTELNDYSGCVSKNYKDVE